MALGSRWLHSNNILSNLFLTFRSIVLDLEIYYPPITLAFSSFYQSQFVILGTLLCCEVKVQIYKENHYGEGSEKNLYYLDSWMHTASPLWPDK